MGAEQWDNEYVVANENTLTLERYKLWGGEAVEVVGLVATPHGYVSVRSEWLPKIKNGKTTFLRFALDGILYERVIKDCYQPRYLVTLAKRFAQEIAGEAHNERTA